MRFFKWFSRKKKINVEYLMVEVNGILSKYPYTKTGELEWRNQHCTITFQYNPHLIPLVNIHSNTNNPVSKNIWIKTRKVLTDVIKKHKA